MFENWKVTADFEESIMLLRLRTVFRAGRKPQRIIWPRRPGFCCCLPAVRLGRITSGRPPRRPETYKENAGWKVAQPRDELPRGRWWELYNDPQLNALEAQVDISNQNLAAAEANYRQALALIRVARAAYFPLLLEGLPGRASRDRRTSGTQILILPDRREPEAGRRRIRHLSGKPAYRTSC